MTLEPFSVLFLIAILILSTNKGTDWVIGRFIVVIASSNDCLQIRASIGIAFLVVEFISAKAKANLCYNCSISL